MIVNHDLKIIFVHIPKTGGEFLRSLIPNQEDIAKHASADFGKRVLGSKIWDEYTKISIVRNPYDLVVSMYEHLRTPLRHPIATYKKHGTLILRPRRACKTAICYPFKRYVEKVLEDSQIQEEYFRTPPVRHFDPQRTWLYKDNVCLVDKIYRFDRLDLFLNDYKHAFKKGSDISTKVNSSERRFHYEQYYDKATARIVFTKYIDDFEIFRFQKQV